MKKRVLYLDYLRVFAAFSVIVLHLAAQNWSAVDVNSRTWEVFNFYDSITRWCVPVFVMISGAIFLNRYTRIKDLYGKYIFRLLIAFAFWSLFYWCVNGGEIKHILINTLFGYYHLWFIPLIIGIYICIPIIKKIIDSETITNYMLVVILLFSFFIPSIIQLVSDFGGKILNIPFSALKYHLDSLNFLTGLGFIFYFIIGYMINKIEAKKELRIHVYILGIIGFTLTILLSLIISRTSQNPNKSYYDYLSLNVCLESLAVFVFIKYNCPNKDWLNKIIVFISKHSFGIYLSHVLVIEKLNSIFGLNSLSFNPIISVPLISIVVLIISLCISWLLSRIPKINKFIV